MSGRRLLFLDRDGTLIVEPPDFQTDSVAKFKLVPGVIPALSALQHAGYSFVMVTNQDGLGTPSYPQAAFDQIQTLLLGIFESQGIRFEAIRICPHRPEDQCVCRKPKTQLVADYLAANDWDRARSAVIGDRATDLELAANLGTRGIQIGLERTWKEIADELVLSPRRATLVRKTKETTVSVELSLDGEAQARIDTGIGFFDHMLEQLSKHGAFSLRISVRGDLHIDEHHTIEDTALALGAALREALGNKVGIERYGFLLPMDESLAQVALDLSGRSYFKFEGKLQREKVGGLATEMVPHFFRSLAESLGANLHLRVEGENTHHQVEALFKGVGRTLKQAIARDLRAGLPSTKGTL
jgi:imidazoleglycerol-phosphate dehydratase/histidinol-phosphatase